MASAEILKKDLLAPLLSRNAAEDTPCSCPPSFKKCRPRKTPDFISSERAVRANWSLPVAEHPEDIDPRLIDDADAQQIFAKVASLVWGHIEEGNAAMAASGQDASPGDDEFHEVHFLRPRFRCCRCWRRPARQRVSEEKVFALLSNVAHSLYFCKQVLLLCAVYIEQLLRETCVMLNNSNWRTLVVAALLIASKVWEDVHPWNADFEACLLDVAGMRYFPGALYKLESLFLEKLGWRVFVNGEVYANYYFALLENRSPLMQSLSSCSNAVPFRPRVFRPRLQTEPTGMESILEDDMWADPDIEQGSPRPSMRHDASQVSLLKHDSSHGSLLSMDMSPRLPRKREWVADLRRSTLAGGDSNTLTSSALRDGWKLDASNPYIGALRHAPPVLAPSRYIEQSAQLLWAHKLATRTAEVLGPPSSRNLSDADSVHTLSGATGSQLQTELRRFLDTRTGSCPQAPTVERTTVGALQFLEAPSKMMIARTETA